MNYRAMYSILFKDLTVIFRTKAVAIPIVIAPIVIMIIIPLAIALPLNYSLNGASDISQFKWFIENNEISLLPILQGYTQEQTFILAIFKYILAPMFLIVPLMVSSIVAADSFAGEKERKTLEALLYTPLTNKELFLAKCLAPWITANVASVISFVVYSTTVNIVSWPYFDKLILPDMTWLILCAWVSPGTAALALGIMVLISSRVRTFMEANQLGGAIVIFVVVIFIGQITGVMLFSPIAVLLLGFVIWTLAIAFIYTGMRKFNRERIIIQL